jgi:O-antigen/teichoic acid export membrane protein
MLATPPSLQRLRHARHRVVSYVGGQASQLSRSDSTPTRVVAGLVDAGLSSLAGLGAGLYAAHFLSPSLLGAYAIYFSAFMVGGFVPVMLYLLPARVASLGLVEDSRLGTLRHTMVRGGLVSGAMALLTPLAGVFVLREVSFTAIAPLGLTAALVVFVSPLQDHQRCVFHLAARPWRAAVVSAVHLTALVAAMAFFQGTHAARQWVPFGSLAVGNVVSLAAGLWLARGFSLAEDESIDDMSTLVRTSWPLLFSTILPICTQFLAGGLIATFGSVKDVGYAEAARVVAQPIHVAALGLGQAITPMLMEGAQAGSRRRVLRARRIYWVLLALCAAVYLPIIGTAHPLNPLAAMLPNAYKLTGLVIFSMAAIFLTDIGLLVKTELAASRNAGDLTGPAVAGSAAHFGFAAAAVRPLGGYTVPLGLALNSLISTVWVFQRANKRLS